MRFNRNRQNTSNSRGKVFENRNFSKISSNDKKKKQLLTARKPAKTIANLRDEKVRSKPQLRSMKATRTNT